MLNHIINLLSIFLPATRFFSFKSFIYGLSGFKLGSNVSFGNCIKSYVLGRVEIGDNVWIGRNVDISVPSVASLIIGSNVDVAPYVKFQCGSHKVGPSARRAGQGNSKSIIIGSGTWIGSSCLILGGTSIGKGTVVAAGSVVLEGNYPDNALLAGVPAIIHKIYSEF